MVLQCLATTTKSVIVFWSIYLPAVNWITWTLCRIVENKISLPDIRCSNGRSEINFLKIPRTWCSTEMILFNPYTCQFVKKQALLSANFRNNIYLISCSQSRQTTNDFNHIQDHRLVLHTLKFVALLIIKHFFSKHSSFKRNV